MTKFNIGDKVRIVNYGQLMWGNKSAHGGKLLEGFPIIQEDEDFLWVDLRPDIVGQEGVVDVAKTNQGIDEYSVHGVGAWFNNDQLEFIKQHNSRKHSESDRLFKLY